MEKYVVLPKSGSRRTDDDSMRYISPFQVERDITEGYANSQIPARHDKKQ